MIKKIAAVGTLVLTLSTCSTPASGYQIQNLTTPIKTVTNKVETNKLVTDNFVHNATLLGNRQKLETLVSSVRHYVGKTWYIFSGNTPSGWDCSGLTMWAYSQIGIDLEHRASIQGRTGQEVSDPVPGDIVAFSYKGYKSAYHVGIYIGNGMMIHAPRKGEVTRIESIADFSGNYSTITYRRLLEII